MNVTLYDITNNFNTIFNEIEELDGELTPELEAQLAITEDNYKQKLENYACVVRDYESDVIAIKAEIERLNNRKKIIENRAERLKQRMFEAVQQFGKVETPKFKIGTRKSTVTNINIDRIDKLKRGIFDFAHEIHDNGVIAFGEECDIEGILAVVNNNIQAKYNIPDEEWIPFTVNDLNVFKININSTQSILSLFTEKSGALEMLLDNEAKFNVDNEINKTELKTNLQTFGNITIGELNEKLSLSIK